MRFYPFIIFFLSLAVGFIFSDSFVFAQSDDPTSNVALSGEKAALESELKKIEEEIAKIEKDISKTDAEKTTKKNQIYILKKKVKKLQLQIRQNNILIDDTKSQINDTESSISQTSLKISDSQKKLANILRIVNREGKRNSMEVLFSSDTLSEFFDNVVSLEKINLKSQEILEKIKELKNTLEDHQSKLEQEQGELENLVKMDLMQKDEFERNKKEEEQLLKITEAQYQKQLKKKIEKQKQAAELKKRIFELAGVPKITNFGDAVEMAKYAERLTGIRPSFLLAILTQESNLGKNVGQCYIKDLATGNGINIRTGKSVSKIMHPTRDLPKFLQILKEVGKDCTQTPVSCPIPSVRGYGGAMGPAQFIPSTWMSYRSRISTITGLSADPWNIKDAFLAAALYLADAGAGSQKYNDEWKSALVYFSGRVNTKYSFYANSAMAIAKRYDDEIKTLENGK